MITPLCRGLKSHKSTLALSYVQLQNVIMPNSRYRIMKSNWMEEGLQSIRWGPIHFGSCGFLGVCAVAVRRCAFDQAMKTMPTSSAPWHGFYLLLSQVSQPGTEHLKEALTLLWIRLTWFMWAGCGFASLCGTASFMSGCLWEYGDGFFACLRVFLKAALRPQAGLDPRRVRIYLSMNLL